MMWLSPCRNGTLAKTGQIFGNAFLFSCWFFRGSNSFSTPTTLFHLLFMCFSDCCSSHSFISTVCLNRTSSVNHVVTILHSSHTSKERIDYSDSFISSTAATPNYQEVSTLLIISQSSGPKQWGLCWERWRSIAIGHRVLPRCTSLWQRCSC